MSTIQTPEAIRAVVRAGVAIPLKEIARVYREFNDAHECSLREWWARNPRQEGEDHEKR